MDTKRKRQTLIALAGLLLLIYFLERIFPYSGGLIVGSSEVVFELGCTIILLSRFSPARALPTASQVLLIAFFGFLALADFSYVTFFYLLHFSPQELLTVLCTKLPYGLAFICGAAAPVFACKRPSKYFFEPSLVFLALLIALPILVRFVAEPYFESLPASQSFAFLMGEAWDIITSGTLLVAALLLFFHSRSLIWSLYASGAVTVVLGDWAIRHETLLGSSPSFGFYEFFWASGIFLCSTLVFVRDETVPEIETRCPTSLLNGLNIVGAIVGSGSVVLLCLVRSNDFDSVRLLTLSVSVVMVTISLISHTCSEWISAVLHAEQGQVPLELAHILEQLLEGRKEMAQLRYRSEISGKAGHDIRAPLAALSSSLGAAELPENIRTLSQNAFQRILKIANSLIEADRGSEDCAPKWVNVLTVADGIVSEKRLRYQDRPVSFCLATPKVRQDFFARCVAFELQRVLSNLIDNAVEAISGCGAVSVEIGLCNGFCSISIADTGKGVEANRLRDLAQKGMTFGKPNGSGLGLYYAKKSVERWGGALNIQSAAGIGTVVTLKLRAC